MRMHDLFSRFFPYALALLPLVLLEGLVFWRLPFPGAHPFLLPFALGLVAQREDVSMSAAYGLYGGIWATFLGQGSVMLFLCPLVGALLALLFRYGLQRGFWAALLGGIAGFCVFDLLRILLLLVTQGAALTALLSLAAAELLWSLPAFPLLYALYAWAGGRRRSAAGGATL